MKINISSCEDLEKVKLLISNYRFNDYRNYHIMKKEVTDDYLFQKIKGSISKNNYVLIFSEKSKLIGLCVLRRLPLESKIFGFNMGKIEYLIINNPYQEDIRTKNLVISCILKLCKEKNILHLSYRIDNGDYYTIHSLETNGFHLMDTLVTYCLNLRRKYILPNVKDCWRIREFRRSDLEELIDIVGHSFSNTRLYIDPHTRNKADEFYAEWTKRCCAGSWADIVKISERKGRINGFATCKLEEKLHNFTGIKVLGRGLIAADISTNPFGIYITLCKALIVEGKDVVKADFGELDTQIQNFSIIKIWQKFGMRILRVKHTFHTWLG